MNTIIDKLFNILAKQAQKIPNLMIIIFIIASIFPNETINIPFL